MKRLIIILIVLDLIFLINGCKNNNHQNNLNNDISNIVSMSNEEIEKNSIITFGFERQIELIQEGHYTFYTAKINTSKYYIIGGYVKESEYLPKRARLGYYYENLTWVNYDDLSKVQETYNDLIISDVYLVFDIKIKKDVVNNKRYNDNYKYYLDATSNYINNEPITNEFIDSKIYYKDALIWYESNLNELEDVYFYYMRSDESKFEVYNKNIFKSYVVFPTAYKEVNNNVEKTGTLDWYLDYGLGSYCDKVKEHLIEEPKLTETFIDGDTTTIVYKSIIDLNKFIEITVGEGNKKGCSRSIR